MGCLGAPGGGAEHNESCVRAQCARDVWVCDSFQGFEPDPWDGDHSWTKQNPVVAVSEEAVRDNFHNYGLSMFLDTSIHFVKGFFADTQQGQDHRRAAHGWRPVFEHQRHPLQPI